MSGLENLKKRIEYRGGARQVDRMVEEKRNSLSKALLYSYQSATAVLSDGREFRCLINPNKISMEFDDKMLSIPFEDICLNKERPEGATTTQGREPTGIKCGDTIEWKENGTHWLIYSQYLQEIAYFRGLMRQCENEPLFINGQKYWYYLKGPDDKGIDWNKSKHFIFNDLNYTVEIYISKTTETLEFFHRFKKCKLLGKNFEVQAVDSLSADNILTVYLKEDYANIWAEEQAPEVIPPEEEPAPEPEVEPISVFARRTVQVPVVATIEGPKEIYPYDIARYTVTGASNGVWELSNKRAKIIEATNTAVTIEITSGKSGDVSLIYKQIGQADIVYNISILSL